MRRVGRRRAVHLLVARSIGVARRIGMARSIGARMRIVLCRLRAGARVSPACSEEEGREDEQRPTLLSGVHDHDPNTVGADRDSRVLRPSGRWPCRLAASTSEDPRLAGSGSHGRFSMMKAAWVGVLTTLAACVPAPLRVGSEDAQPDTPVSPDAQTEAPNSSMPDADASPGQGCRLASDCDSGLACDPNSGACTAHCDLDAGIVCRGGCCSASVCVPGDTPMACGSGGANCAACGGNTPSCSNGSCTGMCIGNVTCGAGFCCTGDGGCTGGNLKTTCGSVTACSDCSMNPQGTFCENGSCGCRTSTDCPRASACDPATHQCTTTCTRSGGVVLDCNGGCCSMESSPPACATGGYHFACGHEGGVCTVCTGLCHPGPRCNAGFCGCFEASECRSACVNSGETCILTGGAPHCQ